MEGNNGATRTISTIFDDQFVDIWPLIYEEFDDIKGVIIIRKSKDRQHNCIKKKDKMTNNDLRNIHIKLKIE
jgi:hypothetical protein